MYVLATHSSMHAHLTVEGKRTVDADGGRDADLLWWFQGSPYHAHLPSRLLRRADESADLWVHTARV